MDPKFLFNLMVERGISYFHLIPGSPIMFREKTLFAPLDSNTLTPQNINEFA
ncbi:MAG: hypothetical protein HYU63_00210, partial [Armatimonadetes bacterium]|nr:hypothetical protein [Armatimonadota bacterium]